MFAIRPATMAMVLLGAVANSAHATTLTVTNTNDSGAGSLRQALASAADGDTINATNISGAITLTTGQLLVVKSVTINGAGADVLAIDGRASSRLFQIASGKTVTISGLTIRNGHDDNVGGGIEIETGASLSLSNSTVSGNMAGRVGNPAVFGGGITIWERCRLLALQLAATSPAVSLAVVAASSMAER